MRRPSKDNRPGMLGQMIGVFGGGLLGLTVGYYALNYFGGPRFNFLEIALPGVPHTQPGWVDPNQAGAAAAETTLAPSPPPPQELAASSAAPSSIPPSGPPHLSEPIRPAFQFPTYSSDDLGRALAAANAALGCEACQSSGYIKRVVVTGVTEVAGRKIEQKAERRFPCEACGGKPTTKITKDVYDRLCQLAHVVTFVEIEPGDPQLLNRKEGLERLLLKAAADREKQSTLGSFAGYALADIHRDGCGVLLAGTVQEVGQQGTLYYARLVLFGQPETVTVISPARAPLKAQDRVLIAGSMLENPRGKLPSYDGSLPLIVWGGLHVRLPAN
jgi:hypothetical protein